MGTLNAYVRTLAVHQNREPPSIDIHADTRNKALPRQKALVHTVPFNTKFYGR